MGGIIRRRKSSINLHYLRFCYCLSVWINPFSSRVSIKVFSFLSPLMKPLKRKMKKKAKYLLSLCKQLHLQLLVVTPSDNIHIVENHISYVHYVERKEEKYSWLYDMPIEQFKQKQKNFNSQ